MIGLREVCVPVAACSVGNDDHRVGTSRCREMNLDGDLPAGGGSGFRFIAPEEPEPSRFRAYGSGVVHEAGEVEHFYTQGPLLREVSVPVTCLCLQDGQEERCEQHGGKPDQPEFDLHETPLYK